MNTKKHLEKTGAFVAVIALLGCVSFVFANNISNFQLTINPGTLSVDIVDDTYFPVANPYVTLNAYSTSFACGSTTGTLGTATQQIYIQNPDAADNGWSVSIAASSTTSTWLTAGTPFDFNDPTTSGCADGADTDSYAGQMTVDASVGTLATGNCISCTTTNVSKGALSAFSEGSTDSITVLTGAAGSDDVGDWTLQGVSIEQTIPANQPANTDYNIDMVLTVAAS